MIVRFIKILESNIFFYIISLAFKAILDISYIYFVSPLYYYSGFNLKVNLKNYILSWVITFFLVLITPNILKKVSDYFLVTFLFSIIFPMFSLFGLNEDLSFFPVLVSLISYIWLIFFLRVRFFNSQIRYPIINKGEKIFQVICYIMIGYLIAWYFISGAVYNFNIDPSKVYNYRSLNSQLTDIGILTYLNIWVFNVFNLSLIAYALWKKKRISFIVLMIIQVFFYGVSAHKSVLLTPFVIVSIYFYFRHTKSLATVPLAFFILVSTTFIAYLFTRNPLLGSIFITRLFYIPNNLTYIYFDYFSNHSFSYWSDSFNFLLEPIYPEGIAHTIGSYIGTGEAANNGFISSGYSQAGILGVLFYVLLTTVILKVVDQLSREVGALWLSLCIVVTPFRTLILSADLMTVILTHGLFIAVIILFLLRKSRL